MNQASHQATAGLSLGEPAAGTVFLMRHATADHNGRHNYRQRDPSLAPSGVIDAQKAIPSSRSPDLPDLILISPLSRAIQTAQVIFGGVVYPGKLPEIQIWPDLRECNNGISSHGSSLAVLRERFPTYDFSECHEEWDYERETHATAVARSERVRQRLKDLAMTYRKIWVVTHSIFLSYLVNVEGQHFWTCESRTYRFATQEEAAQKRYGLNHDLRIRQDFGPTVLIRQE